jgi:uncharacterized protein
MIMNVVAMDMNTLNKVLDEINEDRTVPRNVRTSMQMAKTDLNNEKLDRKIRINNAISILDEISNDPNIPAYTRTQIWNIVSMLETMNKD